MGGGRGGENTAEVKGDSPGGTAGRQRSVWSQNTSAVCQYNDSLNIPHSTLTDHYYRLPHCYCDSTDSYIVRSGEHQGVMVLR